MTLETFQLIIVAALFLLLVTLQCILTIVMSRVLRFAERQREIANERHASNFKDVSLLARELMQLQTATTETLGRILENLYQIRISLTRLDGQRQKDR